MIQARSLKKRYGGVVAVDDLSFEVHPGKVTALLGPNGAGKTTALRLMLGLERGGGTTLFDGSPYRRLRRPATQVGACLGPAVVHPDRKVRAHLIMLASAGGVRRRRVDEVLDLVGLTPVAGARAEVLSAGALGRLGLAAALLGDPHTLLLDEPATGLDPQGVRWLRDFLRAYAAEGRSVLVSGHIFAETAACADRVLVVSRGRLVADESAAAFLRRGIREGVTVRTPQVARLTELLRAEGLEAVRPGGTTLTIQGADRARIGEIAFQGGVLLHELTERTPGLGDAFTQAVSRLRGLPPGTTAASRAAAAHAETAADTDTVDALSDTTDLTLLLAEAGLTGGGVTGGKRPGRRRGRRSAKRADLPDQAGERLPAAGTVGGPVPDGSPAETRTRRRSLSLSRRMPGAAKRAAAPTSGTAATTPSAGSAVTSLVAPVVAPVVTPPTTPAVVSAVTPAGTSAVPSTTAAVASVTTVGAPAGVPDAEAVVEPPVPDKPAGTLEIRERTGGAAGSSGGTHADPRRVRPESGRPATEQGTGRAAPGLRGPKEDTPAPSVEGAPAPSGTAARATGTPARGVSRAIVQGAPGPLAARRSRPNPARTEEPAQPPPDSGRSAHLPPCPEEAAHPAPRSEEPARPAPRSEEPARPAVGGRGGARTETEGGNSGSPHVPRLRPYRAEPRPATPGETASRGPDDSAGPAGGPSGGNPGRHGPRPGGAAGPEAAARGGGIPAATGEHLVGTPVNGNRARVRAAWMKDDQVRRVENMAEDAADGKAWRRLDSETDPLGDRTANGAVNGTAAPAEGVNGRSTGDRPVPRGQVTDDGWIRLDLDDPHTGQVISGDANRQAEWTRLAPGPDRDGPVPADQADALREADAVRETGAVREADALRDTGTPPQDPPPLDPPVVWTRLVPTVADDTSPPPATRPHTEDDGWIRLDLDAGDGRTGGAGASRGTGADAAVSRRSDGTRPPETALHTSHASQAPQATPAPQAPEDRGDRDPGPGRSWVPLDPAPVPHPIDDGETGSRGAGTTLAGPPSRGGEDDGRSTSDGWVRLEPVDGTPPRAPEHVSRGGVVWTRIDGGTPAADTPRPDGTAHDGEHTTRRWSREAEAAWTHIDDDPVADTWQSADTVNEEVVRASGTADPSGGAPRRYVAARTWPAPGETAQPSSASGRPGEAGTTGEGVPHEADGDEA